MSTNGAHRPDDVLKRVHAIGTYYGFVPFSSLAQAKRGAAAKAPYPDSIALEALDPTARQVATLLKQILHS